MWAWLGGIRELADPCTQHFDDPGGRRIIKRFKLYHGAIEWRLYPDARPPLVGVAILGIDCRAQPEPPSRANLHLLYATDNIRNWLEHLITPYIPLLLQNDVRTQWRFRREVSVEVVWGIRGCKNAQMEDVIRIDNPKSLPYS